MMQELQPRSASSLGLTKPNDDENGYHYALVPLIANAALNFDRSIQQNTCEYALISSDDAIRVFNPSKPSGGENTAAVSLGKHESVTCIAPFPGRAGEGCMTGGRDATVRHWDRRAASGSNLVRSCLHKRKAPYLSIASDPNGYLWAAGTELTSHVAEVEIWDMRKTKEPMVTYIECHSDDVSVLQFSSSPSDQASLLSGSTDGLVNIYASSFPSDEDDAVIQTINHGSSIHRAGFLPSHAFFTKQADSAIYALSHDETFAVYKRESAAELADEDERMDDGGEDDSAGGDNDTRNWGDLRPVLNCEYVIDVIPDERGAVVAVGSHTDKRVDLFPLRYKPARALQKSWKLREKPTHRLIGAHGEEIVRSMAIAGYEHDSTILTAGEDGLIRSWTFDRKSQGQDTVMGEGTSAEKSTSKGKSKGNDDGDRQVKRRKV